MVRVFLIDKGRELAMVENVGEGGLILAERHQGIANVHMVVVQHKTQRNTWWEKDNAFCVQLRCDVPTQ